MLHNNSDPFSLPEAVSQKIYWVPAAIVQYILLPQIEARSQPSQRSTSVRICKSVSNITLACSGKLPEFLGQRRCCKVPIGSKIINEVLKVIVTICSLCIWNSRTTKRSYEIYFNFQMLFRSFWCFDILIAGLLLWK